MYTANIKEVIADVVSGNEYAFEKLYNLYYLKIYHLVYCVLQNQYDSEFVVSDVFCMIWEKRYLLEKINNLDAYIYKVSKNASFHYLKKKNDNKNISIDDAYFELPSVSDSIVNDMTEKEMMKIYQLAVDKLPKRCRTVFIMVREQKLSHKEVSEIMGITSGTIEIQMNIAIKKIVSVVKNYYPQLMASHK